MTSLSATSSVASKMMARYLVLFAIGFLVVSQDGMALPQGLSETSTEVPEVEDLSETTPSNMTEVVTDLSTEATLVQNSSENRAIKDNQERDFSISVDNICLSKDCVVAASELFQLMDLTADPCQDFEQFACGTFLKDAIIPDDKSKFSDSFDSATEAINAKGRILLEHLLQDQKHQEPNEKVEEFEADNKLGKYYKSCIDEEKAEKIGVKPLLDVLHEAGGWPILEGDKWSGETQSESEGNNGNNASIFRWKDMSIFLARKGLASDWIMSTTIGPDSKDITTRIIYLDQAGLGLSREYMVQGMEVSEVQAYFRFMVDAANLLGANTSTSEEEMRHVLEFEIALANITAPREERRDDTKLYNPFTLDQLPEGKHLGGLPPNSLKSFIEEYLNAFHDTGLKLENDEKVVVRNVEFVMNSLPELLAKTDKRVLANYMGWRLVKEVVEYLNKDAQDLNDIYKKAVLGKAAKSPRWKTCVQHSGFNSYGSSALTKAAGSLYVRNFFKKDARNSIKEMIGYIQDAFKTSVLGETDWMDQQTAEKALLKLDKMHNFVGFVDELLQPEVMNQYFADLKISEGDYLENSLEMSRFVTSEEVKRFRQPVDPYDWKDNSLTALVNAFYSPDSNVFQITSGILQKTFFGQGKPKYLNFGGIGSVIGHEITHGFDDQGRQRDHTGSLVDWWSPSTSENFKERAQCIIDQYGNYKAKQVDLNLNGINTQGENIADNGGVKIAYKGYENWVEKNGPEKRLPGLSFTPKQLFWISYASTWCTKYTDKGLRNQVLTQYHSPSSFRIIGPLSNNEKFAQDFHCPLGSNMNPEKKCNVW